jgi:TM2 domain-containing membrane protein YozV
MNCANHPELPATVYCQFCGKPLCSGCARTIRNITGCEECLAARLGAAPAAGSGAMPMGGMQDLPYTGTVPPSQEAASPWLAFFLGWIPGVGAMYNGQLAKGLVHVLVMAVLIGLANIYGITGIAIAGWVFYMVFDAYQTAVARRDGLPLPNPLGLNDIGQWFTGQRSGPFPAQTRTAPMSSVGPVAPPPAASAGTTFTVPPPAGPGPAVPPVPPEQYDTPEIHPGVPTGAVVLIAIGVLFLLGNLGVLSHWWFDRSWPLVLIGIGAWLLVRRGLSPPPGGPGGIPGGPQ